MLDEIFNWFEHSPPFRSLCTLACTAWVPDLRQQLERGRLEAGGGGFRARFARLLRDQGQRVRLLGPGFSVSTGSDLPPAPFLPSFNVISRADLVTNNRISGAPAFPDIRLPSPPFPNPFRPAAAPAPRAPFPTPSILRIPAASDEDGPDFRLPAHLRPFPRPEFASNDLGMSLEKAESESQLAANALDLRLASPLPGRRLRFPTPPPFEPPHQLAPVAFSQPLQPSRSPAVRARTAEAIFNALTAGRRQRPLPRPPPVLTPPPPSPSTQALSASRRLLIRPTTTRPPVPASVEEAPLGSLPSFSSVGSGGESGEVSILSVRPPLEVQGGERRGVPRPIPLPRPSKVAPPRPIIPANARASFGFPFTLQGPSSPASAPAFAALPGQANTNGLLQPTTYNTNHLSNPLVQSHSRLYAQFVPPNLPGGKIPGGYALKLASGA